MEKKKKVTYRKVAKTLLQQWPLKLLNRINHDPLWHQVPEMGVECLIATIGSKRELKKAIKIELEKRKKLYRERVG